MKRNMHAAGRNGRTVLAAAAVWLAIAVGAGTAGVWPPWSPQGS
jgi:hypothetical protein